MTKHEAEHTALLRERNQLLRESVELQRKHLEWTMDQARRGEERAQKWLDEELAKERERNSTSSV